MKFTWNKKDEEMFSGIPVNGKEAPPKHGDLEDTFHKAVGYAVDEVNKLEKTCEYDPKLSSGLYTKVREKAIGGLSNYYMDFIGASEEEKFYIGSLPSTKEPLYFGTVETHRGSSVTKRDIKVDYFRDINSPLTKQTDIDLAQIRDLLGGPIFALKKIVMYILYILFFCAAALLMVNDGKALHKETPIAVPSVFGLPAFNIGERQWLVVTEDNLLWMILGTIVILTAVYALYVSLEDYFNHPFKKWKNVLTFLMAVAGLLILVFVILNYTVIFSVFAAGVNTFVCIGIAGILFLETLGTLPQLFTRLKISEKNREKGEKLCKKYNNYLFRAHRWVRLHIIWYENSYMEKAPKLFRRAEKDLKKYGRKAQHYAKRI